MIVDWLDRLFERLIHRFGGLELLQLFLLFFTLECAALGLAAVVTRLSSGFMLILVTAGVLTAWGLTRTRLPNWGYALAGVLVGVFGLGLTVGRTGRALFDVLSSFLPFLGQLLQKKPADPSMIVASWQALGESLTTLAARFGNWFRGVGADTLVIDPLVTSSLWGMIFWLVVFWALWWVRRRASALVGLLPAAALLAYNVFFTDSRGGITWLVLTAGGILMLQACAGFGAARQRWATQGMQHAGIEPRLVLLVVLLAAGMMLAGSLLPSIPIRKIADAIDRMLHPPAGQNLAESLGIEQTPIAGTPAGPFITPTSIFHSGISFMEIHRIASGSDVDQAVVLLVSVDGYSPPPVNEYSNVIFQQTVHYYWRAQTYDRYNGRNWIAGTAHTDEMAADQSFLPDVDIASPPVNYKSVTQHVVRLHPGDQTAYAAGELLSLDQPSILLKRDTGEIISVRTDLNRYTAVSRIPSPSVEGLRAAGSNYPSSILHYLELPEEVPQRVLDLALNLTADQPTPYDKAALLEAYLRQFPYSREVPAPPLDRDAVDFFLFDLKTGYCDYYASAMVVMARAAGLPARLVLGYSEGMYDQAAGHFVVRSANSHAWVEIYFPGFGWVEFEPTASLPRPIRPGQIPESNQAENLPPPGQEAPLSIHLERTWLGRLILRSLALLTVILVIAFLPLETWWLSLLPTDQALKTIFRRLYRRGRFFGIPPDGSRTPNEFALALSSAVERSAMKEKHAALIASLQADLDRLTGLYTRLLFSGHPLEKEEKQQAIRAWAGIRRGIHQVQQKKN